MQILSISPRTETSFLLETAAGCFLVEYRVDHLAVYAPTLPGTPEVVEGSRYHCAHTYLLDTDPDLLVDQAVPELSCSVYPAPLRRALRRWREQEDVIGAENRLRAEEVLRAFAAHPEFEVCSSQGMLAALSQDLESEDERLAALRRHAAEAAGRLRDIQDRLASREAGYAARRQRLIELASRAPLDV